MVSDRPAVRDRVRGAQARHRIAAPPSSPRRRLRTRPRRAGRHARCPRLGIPTLFRPPNRTKEGKPTRCESPIVSSFPACCAASQSNPGRVNGLPIGELPRSSSITTGRDTIRVPVGRFEISPHRLPLWGECSARPPRGNTIDETHGLMERSTSPKGMRAKPSAAVSHRAARSRARPSPGLRAGADGDADPFPELPTIEGRRASIRRTVGGQAFRKLAGILPRFIAQAARDDRACTTA